MSTPGALDDGRREASLGRLCLHVLGVSRALLLLFVDDDRLSYLELAPLGEDASFHPFPDVADIAFGC